jgi:hypothetical protein
MSATEHGFRIARRLRRKHRLIRDEVDALPWPHPRPAGDPRLVYVHISLIYVALGNAILGPPANTVQGRGFGWAATIAFAVPLVLCSMLVIYAAYCKSQYESFGYEMAGCAGFAGTLAIYGVVLILTTPNWALTYNAPFTIALAAGNAARAWVLIRRLW